MKIEPLSSDKKVNRVSFIVSGTDVSFINAMRRTAIDNVPTLAIEDVEVRKNTSVLYDEVVAHRLGLIPLKTDLATFSLPEPGTSVEDMGAASKVTLTIKSSTTGYVYASELKCDDSKVKPVFDETPVVKLLKGQKLELEMKAIMGTGEQHIKWSPGLVHYAYKPEIKISETKNAESIAAKFPKGMVEVKNGKLSVNEEKFLSSRFIDVAEELSEGAIKIEDSQDSFIMHVESWGQLEPVEIMSEASKVFEKNLKEFQKAIKDL